nr:DUF4345 domain-containing protein [Streptomyces sp. 1114.5]
MRPSPSTVIFSTAVGGFRRYFPLRTDAKRHSPGACLHTPDAGPTVGSFGRFMGAVFAGYGAAWIAVARQTPVPARAVRWLAAVLLLGGLGRVLSLAVDGRPHAFQLVLMGIELGLAPV